VIGLTAINWIWIGLFSLLWLYVAATMITIAVVRAKQKMKGMSHGKKEEM